MDEKIRKEIAEPVKPEVVEPVKEEPVKEEPKIEPAKTEPKVEPVKETPSKIVEPTPVPVPELKKVPDKRGVVVECSKLRVRKMPNQNAEVITEILRGSEVKIDDAKSTVGFFKVCTAAGVEGFCMKKYIKVK